MSKMLNKKNSEEQLENESLELLGFNAKEVEENGIIFRKYLDSSKRSNSKHTYDNCTQDLRGYRYDVQRHGEQILQIVDRCSCQKAIPIEVNKESLIYIHDDEYKKTSLSISDLKLNQSWTAAVEHFMHNDAYFLLLIETSAQRRSDVANAIFNTYLAESKSRDLRRTQSFVNYSYLSQRFKSRWDATHFENRNEILTRLKEVDFLVINNFAANPDNNWTLEEFLLPLVEYRYYTKKKTLIVSAISLKTLVNYYSNKSIFEGVAIRSIESYITSKGVVIGNQAKDIGNVKIKEESEVT